ncbi:hypothetical protein ACHAW5_002913 [Stephanodiscus triporus]|uniref:Non-structural maintenance of chromosomes element 4 n=1 Tax=Stephanodiscus triporus TaxID=2934178 RepID=A0ABD3PV44_9STRA
MAKKRSPEDDNEDNVDRDDDEADEDNADDDDEEEEEDHANAARRRKKKKKKRVRIMNHSGQTDADRRLLRRRQRELHNDIAAGGGDGGGGGGSGGGADNADDLTRLRAQNNELWRDVRYTREAVLDSENVDLIASKAARQAEKIIQVPRYDAVRLAQSLVKKGTVRTGSSSQFNWRDLGFQVGVCFNSLPPNVSFLYGPLDAEYAPKERKKVERRKKAQEEESENEEEEQPEDVDQAGQKKSDGNELSAVQKHISVIYKTLLERSRGARGEANEKWKEHESRLSREIDDERVIEKKQKKFLRENSHVSAVECLFNPRSFTQTVEESKAAIKTRTVEEAEEYGGLPGPVIRPADENDKPPPRQAIVSLNMKVAKKEKKGRNSN